MAEPILQRLMHENFFWIDVRKKPGHIVICDARDGYDEIDLSPEDLDQLAHELRDLAGERNTQPPRPDEATTSLSPQSATAAALSDGNAESIDAASNLRKEIPMANIEEVGRIFRVTESDSSGGWGVLILIVAAVLLLSQCS